MTDIGARLTQALTGRYDAAARIPLLCLMLVALPACASDGFSDNEVIGMAHTWSGADRRPVCRRTGPDGEELGSADARYCEWRSPSTGGAGTLTAIVRPQATMVTWRRTTASVVDADRLTDSIRTALLARGLTERTCGTISNLSGESRGVRWESSDLVVDVTRSTPHRGTPSLQIIAIDAPAEMPQILCGRPTP